MSYVWPPQQQQPQQPLVTGAFGNYQQPPGLDPAAGGAFGAGMPQARPPGPTGGRPQLNPADIEAILATNGMKPQEDKVARQRKLAEMMRTASMSNSGLEGVHAGGVYKAPSWGSVLGKVGQAYMGGQQDQQAGAASDVLAQQGTAASQRFFDMLRGIQSKQGTPVVPADYGG